LAWLVAWFSTNAAAQSARIAVVYTSEAAPYTEALDGLCAALPNLPLAILDLRSTNAAEELARLLGTGSNRVLISIGREALEQVSARNPAMPLVATMIMRSEQDRAGKIAAAVHLDIPPSDVLAEMRRLFPAKTRAAIIRNPTQPGQTDSAAAVRARLPGFSAQVIDARTPEELLRAVRGLNGHVDLVVCLPDSGLYNSATVKPLILASLESHLLIVGFSASFVRAGAGVGVYPDFRDIGAQAGEIARRELAGQPVTGEQGPRKLVVAVNQRVIRLLGLDYQPRPDGEVVTFR
jgi:ABC-type uncharacterized transport system substrate-binding protein